MDLEKKAEDLRLRGNDAFGTKDYERAIQLYRESVATKPQAKAYSNLAACLCKLGRYKDAEAPSERATSLDGKWAKGWWRRGVVAELLKKYICADSYFSIAVKLSPKEKSFRKALQANRKRLGFKGKKILAGGPKDKKKYNVMESPEGGKSSRDLPGVKAIQRVAEKFDSDNLVVVGSQYRESWPTIPSTDYPKAWQYIYQGSLEWYGGVTEAIALVTRASSAAGTQEWQRMKDAGAYISHPEATRLLGGAPSDPNSALSKLVSGIAHLGGMYVSMEMGIGDEGYANFFCPPGEILQRFTSYGPTCQVVGLCLSIDDLLTGMVRQYKFSGKAILVSDAVAQASATFYANIQRPIPYNSISKKQRDQKPSPQECIDFIKLQLRSGKTWNQIRPYISLMYRGTIMWAFIVRHVVKQDAEAYEYHKWAIEFIDLADEEFSVTKNRDFAEKGSAFRYSLRIGVMMNHLSMLKVLGTVDVHGPYSLLVTLDLALKISKLAHKIPSQHRGDAINNNSGLGSVDYGASIIDYAHYRKPLSLAHSTIATTLITLGTMNATEFQKMALRFGLIMDHHELQNDKDQFCDPFALMAKHYGIAAKNSLLDDDNTFYFWWGNSYAMCLSDPQNQWCNLTSDPRSKFTVGELRKAISQAEAAERARDIELFGKSQTLEFGSFRTVAKMTENFYRDKDDSFVLPKVDVVRSADKSHLKADGEIFCTNFHEIENEDLKKLATMIKNENSEVEDKHGIDRNHMMGAIPSLETLCIRELHNSECEFAKGECDGAIIQYKAMMAAAAETSNDAK